MTKESASAFERKIKEEENQLSELDDSSETPPSDIVAFNELRSCADLLRMHKAGQLEIHPEFQRDVVWKNPAKTRFIDSLVKQLPIPSMCISLDYNTNSRMMIDGLQRISSIIEFFTDPTWRLSDLEDIDPRIAGKTARQIEEEHYAVYSQIENVVIPITVLRCDYSKKSHMNYLFTIFHRLNTGGTKLNNQEIRNCIYSGMFNAMLNDLASEELVENLFGRSSYRFAIQEMFLRVFCFSETVNRYNGKLARYLNDYMDENRSLEHKKLMQKYNKIMRVVKLLYSEILGGSKIPSMSKATTEAVLVGIYLNIASLEKESPAMLRRRFEKLKKDRNFSVENLSENIASADKVKARIKTAKEIFSKNDQ